MLRVAFCPGMMKEKRCALLFPGRRKIASEPPESDTVAVLKVKLHCPACVSEVTKGLQKLPGVMEVSVDAKAEIISVKGRHLEARKLSEGLWRKSGKRCEVVVVSSIEEVVRQLSTTTPPTQDEDTSAGSSGGPPLEPVPQPADAVEANGEMMVVSCLQDASHNSAEVHEPRFEINQQTHTVIYGWPSQYQSPPSYWAASNPADYYLHYPDFRYEELFSEENPNACNVM